MSFIERFQGKISKVNKTGLKETLFKISRVQENPEQKVFNQSARSHQLNVAFKKAPNSPRLRRTQSVRSQNASGYNSASPVRQKNNRRGYVFNQNSGSISSKPEKYIDQMLERHAHLLQLIDKKTSWKGDKK